MKLRRYRVTNFRSVQDSGWLNVDDVTALIGVNESGKTNLLLPLWKLRPARDGELLPTSDWPKADFAGIRNNPGSYAFITAEFSTGEDAVAIARQAGIRKEEANLVQVTRFFDERYRVIFPGFERPSTWSRDEVASRLEACAERLADEKALKQEAQLQPELVQGVRQCLENLPDSSQLGQVTLSRLARDIEALIPEEPAKTSVIVPVVQQLSEWLDEVLGAITAEDPGERKDVTDLVVSRLPSFVYYSNYGNLDSEIYLPHVVENLGRDDLGSKELAKARTLKVLFNFVGLEPSEILELGQDPNEMSPRRIDPSEEEVAEVAENKRTRSILLQSAGTKLTEKFREWWKQGDYRFRFEADGNHFRIWVADDRRPTEVELENRSTGLQWFLSFYLVFLVETQEDLQNCILLLDEPGMSLHPLAQRDLTVFFDNLATTNQMLYTSHSPFLVDADRLERARKVYVGEDGTTKVTANLRHDEGKNAQSGAAYAVHSALNLTVAESLLVGCCPILVEGASDQHYLTLIKSLLLSAGKITPKRELVFPPCGGTKTARVIASILTGRDDELPMILLDGDPPGRRLVDQLKRDLYVEHPDKVLCVADSVELDAAEIEDLMPAEYLAEELDRMIREAEVRLADVIKSDAPFVGQTEQWAAGEHLTLPQGWKVDLAIRIKKRALQRGLSDFPPSLVEKWVALFNTFG